MLVYIAKKEITEKINTKSFAKALVIYAFIFMTISQATKIHNVDNSESISPQH